MKLRLAQTQVIPSVAETNRLKNKQVKGVIESLFGVATNEIKKLKKKATTPAKKGIDPFTKAPCVFKSNPASNTLRALAMKKLKEALKEALD